MPKHYKEKEKREPVPGADKFTTEQEALDRADELGCEGTHSMDEDGQMIFMPCSTHDIYDAAADEEDRALRAPVPGVDKFSTEEEALDRAEELGCEGTHTMDEDGQVIYMPCSTHEVYDDLASKEDDETRPYHDEEEDEDRQPAQPAPESEQITGSDKNKPGTAAGPGGDIKLNDATEKALRNKVTEHNADMKEAGKPPHTRTTYGQLAAVYRRGAGAYSGSHRPGVSRAAWSMARVNAYLYLLRNGRPQNPKYVTDNDLLPKDHPKSTRSAPTEDRQVNLDPPAYMRASARRGLEWHRAGLSGDGLEDRTVTEARAMAAGNVTPDKWTRTAAWIARHLVDMDAPANTPGNDDYPGAGAVAMALWGGGGSKRSAERALEYAQGVVARIVEENEGRNVAGQAKSTLERRQFEAGGFEIREDGDGFTIEGYAALFDSRSENLGGFTETIQRGAFRKSLDSRNNVMFYYNHNSSQVLASTRAGTLQLEEDERGLRVTASVAPTSYGRDAKILVERGDVTGFSFGFSMPAGGGDEWNADGTERILKTVRLFEVSLVGSPAYTETNGTAMVRGLDSVAERADVDPDDLADALLKIENGENITSDDRQLLDKVLAEISPASDEPNTDDTYSKEMLALKKKKLQLLMGTL